MNFLQSRKHFPQLLLLEFHEKHLNVNLYPSKNIQFEYSKLNFNYSQNNGLIRRKIEKSWIPTLEDKIMNSLNLSNEASLTMQLPFDSISYAPFKKPIDTNITNNSYLFNRQWCYINLGQLISIFYKLMIENTFIWTKRNYKIFCQLLGSIYAGALKNKEKFLDIISINRNHSEGLLMNTIENKITNVMQELHQIRKANEEALLILKQEIMNLQNSNRESDKKIENISNVLENISMNFKSIVLQPIKSISATKFSTPPPPPPPMPPLPTSFSLSTTPKSTKKGKNSSTPTKKLSIMEERPVITVEDLLKVSLKKVPPKNKKENEKKSEVKGFGPLVTTDMLKKVKLKSIKCKNNNENIRLPLRTLKNNENKNQS